jgi:membrane-bound inhibitor of C-type lysozyme
LLVTDGILSPSGSGARYDADFGVFFWVQGDEAQVAWPQENEFNCVVRK